MSYIEVCDYVKEIKGIKVLKNINLKMNKGKIYGFWGRNGSGKTMLFRAIGGLIKPTSGYVKVNNKTICKDINHPENLGIIIETVGFWNQHTGFDNLKLLASINNKISDKDIENVIERVGLDKDDKKTVKKYSLGMRQRLAIAQAIMEKPDLIIVDEPTNSLDEDGVKLVRKIFIEEKNRGATILLASHNKEDIELLSDEKYIMNSGELKQN